MDLFRFKVSYLLKIENISVKYGELQVLWDISLEVGDQEIVFLIGANGHGKSTVLRTISGLVKPKSGMIKLDSREIQNLSPQKLVEEGIIHVPEGDKLFPYMSVLENLKLGAYTNKAWKVKEKNMKKVFDLFPFLEKRRDQMAWSLSGGERRMVSVGRGLMSNAKYLLIDEPSLGLAPKTTKEVYQKIAEINNEGISLLIVEQNISLVSEFAKRVYLLESGRIRFEGKVKELLENEVLKEAYLGA